MLWKLYPASSREVPSSREVLGPADLTEAMSAFRKALDLDPNLAGPLLRFGASLGLDNKLPEAIAVLQLGVEADPKNARAHGALGYALLLQGSFARALASTQKALDLVSTRDSLRPQMEGQLKKCQAMLTLEKRLPLVLAGNEQASGAELAILAQTYLERQKRYVTAVRLYEVLLKREDKSNTMHRYNAACAAVRAATGKGEEAAKLEELEKAKFRGQALDWLKIELATLEKQVIAGKPLAVMVAAEQIFPHWQADADLSSVRNAQELARLPQDERQPWEQLWSDVSALAKRAGDCYTKSTLKGSLTAENKEQVHEVKLTAGNTCIIDLQSSQFDTYLRLEDDKGKILDENDDISKDNLNSRIIFTPETDGVYRIIATSYQQRGRGAYEVILREFGRTK